MAIVSSMLLTRAKRDEDRQRDWPNRVENSAESNRNSPVRVTAQDGQGGQAFQQFELILIAPASS